MTERVSATALVGACREAGMNEVGEQLSTRNRVGAGRRFPKMSVSVRLMSTMACAGIEQDIQTLSATLTPQTSHNLAKYFSIN